MLPHSSVVLFYFVLYYNYTPVEDNSAMNFLIFLSFLLKCASAAFGVILCFVHYWSKPKLNWNRDLHGVKAQRISMFEMR